MKRYLWGIPLLILGLAAASLAVGDDSDIFLVDSVPPNVMILLDSSGSMSDEVNGEKKIDSAKHAINQLITSGSGIRFGIFRFNGSEDGGLLVAPLGSDTDVMAALVNSIKPKGSTPLGQATQDIQDYFMGQHISATCLGDGCEANCNLGGAQNCGGDSGRRHGGRSGNCTSVPSTDCSDNDDDSDSEDGSCGWDSDQDSWDEPGETVCDAPEVFSNPALYPCQKNYAILVTDGMPTGEAQDLVAQVATSLYTTDHHPTMDGVQNVIVHTVGFAVPEGAALLTQTAANGGGSYFQAGNEDQLQNALRSAMSAILADAYSLSSPVVPAGSVSGGTKAYLASFQPVPLSPSWKGYLRAYTRDTDGSIPVDGDGQPDASSLAWDAGALLATRAPADRTIYTVAGGTRQALTTTNTNLTTAMFAVASSTEKNKIIEFTRGTDSFDDDADGNSSEARAWKLGDLLHSEPVLVYPPPARALDSDYNTFRTDRASRPAILVVGANDGMLHAFRASDGVELWAFIPPDLLDDLKLLTPRMGPHPYLVDGSPVVADVKTGGSWKTIVVFGLRRGGGGYYALDISDTTNPGYLWKFSDTEITEGWSRPQIGTIRMSDNSSKYLGFVGGGYNTANNNASGRGVFAFDLATGTKIWQYMAATGSDKQYANFSFPAEPTILDLDFNGFVDRIYIGDVGGQLWKFDTSAAATVSSGLITNWTGKRLFAAAPTQANPPVAGEYVAPAAMYGSPRVAFDSYDNLWVHVGTGDRDNPKSTSSNKFYGIKDNTTMTNAQALTESNLVNITSGTAVTQGWYRALPANEKVLSTADVFNKTVYFTTYVPATNNVCEAMLGTSNLFAIRMLDGLPAINWANGQSLTSPTTSDPAFTDSGDGISSDPGILLGDTTDTVIVSSSEGALIEISLPASRTKRIQYWREIY